MFFISQMKLVKRSKKHLQNLNIEFGKVVLSKIFIICGKLWNHQLSNSMLKKAGQRSDSPVPLWKSQKIQADKTCPVQFLKQTALKITGRTVTYVSTVFLNKLKNCSSCRYEPSFEFQYQYEKDIKKLSGIIRFIKKARLKKLHQHTCTS